MRWQFRLALTLIGGIALVLSACAPRASEIAPAAISPAKYRGWTCEQLIAEQAFVEEALVRVSDEQDSAARRDTITTVIIGVPTSGGGVKGEVARLKGEKEALRVAMRDAGCN